MVDKATFASPTQWLMYVTLRMSMGSRVDPGPILSTHHETCTTVSVYQESKPNRNLVSGNRSCCCLSSHKHGSRCQKLSLAQIHYHAVSNLQAGHCNTRLVHAGSRPRRRSHHQKLIIVIACHSVHAKTYAQIHRHRCYHCCRLPKHILLHSLWTPGTYERVQ